MPLVIDQKDLDLLPITIDPEIVSGAPVFRGTRVPVDALISNLEAGLTLDEFLDNFPTVTREQAIQVLEFSKTTLLKLRKTARKFFSTNPLPACSNSACLSWTSRRFKRWAGQACGMASC